MNILDSYYIYAKLAQAAYIDLSAVATPTEPRRIMTLRVLDGTTNVVCLA